MGRQWKKKMVSVVGKIVEKGLANPPKFLPNNVMYETMMGSVAYGVSSDTSDMDIYGFCIPPKDMIFPHLRGEILDFGKQKDRFYQWQQHHIYNKEENKVYDVAIYSIVKYFDLVMAGNPNMIDSIFTPAFCVLKSSKIAEMVRGNRKLFLSKKCWHTFKGYSYAQMNKIRGKTNAKNNKRALSIEKYGYDVKYAYHLVRLLNEVEQILIEGDLDLLINREQLKSIRRGEWNLEDIEKYFTDKEKQLEKCYIDSKIPHTPPEDKIKQLLLDCLEEHYGNLDSMITVPEKDTVILNKIIDVLSKSGKV